MNESPERWVICPACGYITKINYGKSVDGRIICEDCGHATIPTKNLVLKRAYEIDEDEL